MKRGQLASARSRLDWVLWFHPRNAAANLVMGKIEFASGATEEAIACFRVIPQSSSIHRTASIELANALTMNGQITAAEVELKQHLQRYEPTESVWDLYFRLLYLQTRTRDVISLFEQKLSQPPQSLSDARFLLKAEFVPQDPSETLATLEEILRRHPEEINAQASHRMIATGVSVVDLRNRRGKSNGHFGALIVPCRFAIITNSIWLNAHRS